MVVIVWIIGICLSWLIELAIFNDKGYWSAGAYLTGVAIWTLCMMGYEIWKFLL